MQDIGQERHSWLKLFVILTWLFLYGLVSVLGGGNDIALNLNDPKIILILYIGQIAGVLILFIFPALLFAIFWTKARGAYLGLSAKPAFTTLIIGSVGILLAQPMINWLADINQHMHLPSAFSAMETWMKNSEAKAAEMTDVFTKGTSVGGLILNLFVVAFLAAFSEELFFRGILQKVLIECFKNKHVGIWLSAIFFSAFHMQFFGFLPRMLMGAYLGYLFAWSGSIWPGMIAHFVNNGMTVFLVWLSNRGVITADADKIGIEENQMIYVISSIVMVIVSLILVYRIEKKRKVTAIENIE
ncbi:MAG: CPBP family intramembrane glutamic endopeptidase [Bacteroidia bacterium]